VASTVGYTRISYIKIAGLGGRSRGIDPPLQPGETLSWIGLNPATGRGINAAVYCFDPARDGEPYVLSLGAYDEARIAGPNGEDYGTDRKDWIPLEAMAPEHGHHVRCVNRTLVIQAV
jgi:hypothetical protein